jgi:hypothetical protein
VIPETSRKVIARMTTILGNDSDKTLDEYTIRFMTSIFPHTLKPLVNYKYAQYLANNIYFQLSHFKVRR